VDGNDKSYFYNRVSKESTYENPIDVNYRFMFEKMRAAARRRRRADDGALEPAKVPRPVPSKGFPGLYPVEQKHIRGESRSVLMGLDQTKISVSCARESFFLVRLPAVSAARADLRSAPAQLYREEDGSVIKAYHYENLLKWGSARNVFFIIRINSKGKKGKIVFRTTQAASIESKIHSLVLIDRYIGAED